MQFVREHFPALAPEYARRYAHADFADAAYKKQMSALVKSICKKHGIGERTREPLAARADQSDVESEERKKPIRVAMSEPQALLFA